MVKNSKALSFNMIIKVNRQTTVKRLDQAIEYALCAMIISLSFSIAAMESFYTCAFLCWLIKRSLGFQVSAAAAPGKHFKKYTRAFFQTFKPVKTNLSLPLAVFVFLGFLSMLTSFSFSLSFRGFFSKVFQWIAVYYMIAEVIQDKKRLVHIILATFFSMALVGIDGIVQIITGYDFLRHYSLLLHNNQVHRVRGPFKNPNSFAAWCVFMIPLALSFAYYWNKNLISGKDGQKWQTFFIKASLWVLGALLITCLILTFTRGAWIAAFLGILFLGIQGKKIFLSILPSIIIFIVLIFVIAGKPLEDRAITILSVDDGGTKNARVQLYKEAFTIIKDFPLLGCGLNTYTAIVPLYKKLPYTGYYPHNCYLQMAAEQGILGLGTFLWILFVLFKTSLVDLKNINDAFYKAILIGLLSGLFGFLAHSFIDSDIYTLQGGNLMWFMLGLISAVQNIAVKKNNARLLIE